MNAFISSLVVFGFGFALGTRKLVIKEPETQRSLFLRYALMALSSLLIIGFSYGIDQIVHRLLPDVCVFAILNCVLTIIFYGTAAHYFFYLACQKTHHFLFRQLTPLWGKYKFVYYPLLAVLLALPFQVMQSGPQNQDMSFPVVYFGGWLHSLQAGVYILGITIGVLVRTYVFARLRLAILENLIQWLLFLIIFSCFGYQLSSFVSFNMVGDQLLPVRFASVLTLTLIGFHLLYLNVWSDNESWKQVDQGETENSGSA